MMRLKQPRISPLTRDEVDPALADAFSEDPGRNVIATFARHIALITKWGPRGWSAIERAILKAAEELHGDAFISDETWSSLEEWSDQKKMDLIFTVGQYMTISMALNSLGVQLEPGVSGFPEPSRTRE